MELAASALSSSVQSGQLVDVALDAGDLDPGTLAAMAVTMLARESQDGRRVQMSVPY